MSGLRQGDIVRTVTEIQSVCGRGLSAPRGTAGLIGPFLRTEIFDGETLEVFDFVPAEFPGRWEVTEYHVKLLKREK